MAKHSVRQVDSGGRAFAVVHLDGEFFVLDNACAHVGGPLGHGNLVKGHVICPWHAWAFDCRTGCVDGATGIGVKTYPVTLTDGELFIEA